MKSNERVSTPAQINSLMNSNLVSQRNSGRGEEFNDENFEFHNKKNSTSINYEKNSSNIEKKSSKIEKKSSMTDKKSSIFGSKRESLESSINSKGRKMISAQSSRLSTKGKTPLAFEPRQLNEIGEIYEDE